MWAIQTFQYSSHVHKAVAVHWYQTKNVLQWNWQQWNRLWNFRQTCLLLVRVFRACGTVQVFFLGQVLLIVNKTVNTIICDEALCRGCGLSSGMKVVIDCNMHSQKIRVGRYWIRSMQLLHELFIAILHAELKHNQIVLKVCNVSIKCLFLLKS